jgi:hypothetical protein
VLAFCVFHEIHARKKSYTISKSRGNISEQELIRNSNWHVSLDELLRIKGTFEVSSSLCHPQFTIFHSTLGRQLSRGITIDGSDENENANDSIRINCEFDSNVIDESDLQDEKQFDPRISTFLGIKID